MAASLKFKVKGAEYEAAPVKVERKKLYAGTPTDLELLDEKGSLALYCGRTAEDAAFVAAELERDHETPMWRNSLFLRRPTADGGTNGA